MLGFPLSDKWSVFIITYFGYAVIYITRKAFSVVKTLIQSDLHLSTYILSTVDSVFLTTYAIFQVFLPSLSDSVGVRPVIVLSFLGAALFSFSFSIARNPQTLIIAWLFEGIAHASVFAVFIKAVTLWFPTEERGTMLGLWTTSQQIGGILATSLSTYISTTYGWRETFLISGLITAVAGCMMFLVLPEPPNITENKTSDHGCEMSYMSNHGGKPPSISGKITGKINEECSEAIPVNSMLLYRPSDDLGQTVSNPTSHNTSVYQLPTINKLQDSTFIASPPMTFMKVLLIPGLISCGIAYFCVKLVRYALLFWLPYFLITQFKFSAASAGYSSMIFDIGGVFGSIASGFIVDKIFKGRRMRAIAAMCGATAFSLLIFSYATHHLQYKIAHPRLIVFSSTTSEPLQTYNYSSSAVDFELDVPENPTPNSLDSQLLRRLFEVPHADPEGFVQTTFAEWTTVLLAIGSVGFFVAGPDSVLGATAAGHLCEQTGMVGAQAALSTATGIVNGLGAFGGVAQGYVTALISETLGWSALFCVFSIAAVTAVFALAPSIARENSYVSSFDPRTIRKNGRVTD